MVGLLALGCVSGSNTYYPLQKRPVVPSVAIGDPDVWVKCSSYGSPPEAIVSRMYCVELVHVEELRRYIIEMDALVSKYENTIETHNSSVD